MSRRSLKARLYRQLARIGKAVSSPHRLDLLEILAQGERTVEALATATAQPVANASHHLRALREARLVDARKDGLHVHYRLSGPDVFDLTRLIGALARRHLAEVDRIITEYFAGRDRLEPVTREDLLDRVRARAVVVLDVRPAEEYRAGHIPGAISVPLAELERRLAELPRGRAIVAYCRGPYCLMSYEAVELLRARGRRARRLVDGFPEWRAAGLPVEIAQAEAR